jgi:DNA helicase-2/ATP-dependent DNA helicase PcrA
VSHQPLTSPEQLSVLLDVPFTAEQLAAATAPLEPGVVIAGAGSGKTTVMAARVVWLVASGRVRPEQVLGLTFTNKAAGELAQRIRAALRRAVPAAPVTDPGEQVDGEPTVATYHAYAGRLLREHGLRIGLEPRARLLADATRFQLVDRVLRRAPGPFVALNTGVRTLVGDVVSLDGELSEHLVTVEALRAEDAAIARDVASVRRVTAKLREVADTAAKRDELATLVELVRAEKAHLGTLDFGDQLAAAARLVSEHPAVGEIERDRFRVVLLDEYQDTSVAQKQLLVGLFGGGHPVTAVGDPFQAIYGWRGASVANIDAFPQDFPRADGTASTRYGLSRNNRSGGRLLGLANALAGPLRERHPGSGLLQPRPGVEDAGETVCALLPTYADEVAWVTDRVQGQLDSGMAPRDIALLVRVRSDFPAYHDALAERGIPVEVVGLGGLLALPEVSDVVATLEVLDEPTANAALLRLLTGPRWRIGPRDLALLGRRAVHLVRGDQSQATDDIELLLEEAVAGVDPADVVSLVEALDHPGGAAYSAAARQRFKELADELRALRRHLGEPLLDLVARVVSTTGLDVEVGAAPAAAKAHRAEALGSFLEQAEAFADLDGDPSVRAFLSYLRAAEEFDRGLDTTAPSPSDSVKLLTVHKAKGLEWPVVVLPNLTSEVFPAKRGRSRWTKAAKTLPTTLRGDADDFPVVADWSNKGLDAFDQAMAELDQLEERRLGYVAVTRAKQLLIASSHWWGPSQRRPRGPSAYLEAVRSHCEAGGGAVEHWEPPPDDDANPALLEPVEHPWPVPLQAEPLAARREAAELVRAALAGQLEPTGEPLSDAERARVAEWDRDLEVLLTEARLLHRVETAVPLPSSLSASGLVRLAADPDGFARDLVRPMPRPPAPAAHRGTRFHAWVESLFGEQPLLDRSDLEGAADDDLVPDAQLRALQQAFLAGPYARLAPHRVEAPFQLVLGGRVVRGRIDAVYRTDDGGYDVIDWKTGSAAADPLQLAIYRTAWAQIAGVAEESVGAAFYYVGSGTVERPAALPSGAELERLLTGTVRAAG